MTALADRLRQHAANLTGNILILDRSDAQPIINDLRAAARRLDDFTSQAVEDAPKDSAWPAWLRELETVSGRAYQAASIRWFRVNCHAQGMTPAEALALWEKEFGL